MANAQRVGRGERNSEHDLAQHRGAHVAIAVRQRGDDLAAEIEGVGALSLKVQ